MCLGAILRPSVTCTTGNGVWLASSAGSALSCWGERCCTNTIAALASSGRAPRSWEKASRPPAEAPTPTTVGTLGSRAGVRESTTTSSSAVSSCSDARLAAGEAGPAAAGRWACSRCASWALFCFAFDRPCEFLEERFFAMVFPASAVPCLPCALADLGSAGLLLGGRGPVDHEGAADHVRTLLVALTLRIITL